MAEILAQVRALEDLDQSTHWFCNRNNHKGSDQPTVHPASPSSGTPRETIKGCYRLFAYDTEDISSQKDFLVKGIDQQLGRCDTCIIEYYKSKKEFLDELREEYNDDDVEVLASMFHQYDADRIQRGLAECSRTLRSIPEVDRTRSAVPQWALFALTEALTSERWLVNHTLVREYLVRPLELVQTNTPFSVHYCVPAMSELLVHENEILRQWATRSVRTLPGNIKQEDFDFAFRGGLARHLEKASVYPIDLKFTEYLWLGLELIVNHSDRDLVDHSLRALDVSIHRLALDHLQIPFPGMRYIVRTLFSLLKLSADGFWDAMGAIGPSTVAEQIFRSPQFLHVLQSALAGQCHDDQSALADVLRWPRPLIESLQVGQRPPLCRTVVSQLVYKLQRDDLAADTREACLIVGLDCLACMLTSCIDGINVSDATSHAVVVDALALTWEYIEVVVSVVGTPSNAAADSTLQNKCRLILETTLRLECKELHIAFQILQSRSQGSTLASPKVWKMLESRVHSSNAFFPSVMLAAMESAIGLTRMEPAGASSLVKEYNVAVEELFASISRTLDKVGAFSSSELAMFAKDEDTVCSLATLLPCPEPHINEPALELVKSITEEPFRKEALRSFLTFSLHGSLNGLSQAAQSIIKSKAFKPCPLLLKVYTDVLDALCDPQGLLRQSDFPDTEDAQAISHFWDNAWSILAMMYRCSETWSTRKVASSDVLREFVRDVMQLSESLFDQFAVFNAAINSAQEGTADAKIGTGEGECKADGAAKSLLIAPSIAMNDMTLFLRLKDEYLLRTSVQLVRKLLNTLTKEGMVLSSGSSDFLAQVAIYKDNKNPQQRIGIKTLLTPTEIAGIAFDLEENLGRPIVDEARGIAMMGKGVSGVPTREIKGEPSRKDMAASTSLSLQQKSKKQGIIDFGTWSSQAEQLKGLEKHRVRENSLGKASSDSKDNVHLKTRTSTHLMDRKSGLKGPQSQKTAAQQEAFLNERKRQKQEAEARRAEQAARIKRNIPNLIAGQTSGEGSALAKIGVAGKDHAPKGESMMVSSDSGSDSDDEFDKELFGGASKNKTSSVVSDFNATRAKQMRSQAPVKKTKIIRSVKDMRARLAPQMSGLWSRLLAWEFFHDGDFPPDSTKEDYSLVTDTFRTAADYRKAFEALLLLEAWSSLRKSKEEGSFRSFEVKVSNRITVDSLFEVNIVMEPAQCKSMGIFEADIILLSKSAQATEDAVAPHCLGRIHRIRYKKGAAEITVRIAHGPLVPSVLSPNAPTYAARLDSIVTLEREYGALAGLEWYDLCQEIIEAQISPMLTYGNEKLERIANVYKLNSAQSKAVQSAMDNDAFTLIQGPPGSGKTKTITAIVGALLSDTIKSISAVSFNGPSETARAQVAPAAAAKKLLVCAPSNAAVDELVMRFMAGVKGTNGTFHKPKVVRLGRSDKVNPQVLEVTLDELVDKIVNPTGGKGPRETTELERAIDAHKAVDKEIKEMYVLFEEATSTGTPTDHDMTKKFEKLKRDKQGWSSQIERLRDSGNTAFRDADIKKRQVEQKVLNDAHIICATLSGSARESFQHLTIDFETVIIDEAAQCIELSALIPLKYGCSKCIMVGDPKQLPPTVLSREAARFQYEQSLFVRMQRNQPQDVHLLDTQYRMHPAISRFPSKAFYEGKLLDGPDMAKLRTQPWHEDKLLGPYQFYDVAGKHESAIKGHSLINKSEVEVAIELYRRLQATVRGYDFRGKIGIITPYKSQLKLLGERFVAVFGPEIQKAIEFNTTDAFQGRESEIIIFSCVRASNRGIGFLSDIRRMNVGITRAKSSLWVLGSSQSLMQGEYWRGLIKDAQERGFYSTGNIVHLLKESPKVSRSVVSKQVHGIRTSDLEGTRSSGPPRIESHDLTTKVQKDGNSKKPDNRDGPKGQKTTSISLEPDLVNGHPRNGPTDPAVRRDPAAPVKARDLLSNQNMSQHTDREETPTELKRKRSNSPPISHNIQVRPPPPRKPKKDDAAFLKPRRKR